MKMIHSCLRVLDLERSLEFYATVFGLKEHARCVLETFTLLYLRHPGEEFELELTTNHGRTKPYDIGDGYGHIAFVTDDIEMALQRYHATGAEKVEISALDYQGALLGRFFFATDPDGYKVEVLAREGRFA